LPDKKILYFFDCDDFNLGEYHDQVVNQKLTKLGDNI